MPPRSGSFGWRAARVPWLLSRSDRSCNRSLEVRSSDCSAARVRSAAAHARVPWLWTRSGSFVQFGCQFVELRSARVVRVRGRFARIRSGFVCSCTRWVRSGCRDALDRSDSVTLGFLWNVHPSVRSCIPPSTDSFGYRLWGCSLVPVGQRPAHPQVRRARVRSCIAPEATPSTDPPTSGSFGRRAARVRSWHSAGSRTRRTVAGRLPLISMTLGSFGCAGEDHGSGAVHEARKRPRAERPGCSWHILKSGEKR